MESCEERIETQSIPVVATKSSSEYTFDGLYFDVAQPYSSTTVPIDMTYYKKDEGMYVILQDNNVDKKNIELLKYISIPSDGIINRIILNDLPMCQYILTVNNQNCATSTFNSELNCCEFNLSGKQSQMLSMFISSSKTNSEPQIQNRQTYLNFARCDIVGIIFPKTQKLNSVHTITLHGYFPTTSISGDKNTQYIEKSEVRRVYQYSTYKHINCPWIT